jgi:hypothetical protein
MAAMIVCQSYYSVDDDDDDDCLLSRTFKVMACTLTVSPKCCDVREGLTRKVRCPNVARVGTYKIFPLSF